MFDLKGKYEHVFLSILNKYIYTFTIDFVFENCFWSVMAPYVDSRDERSLSIYGSECQIWKTFTTICTAIDPNKDISKTREVHVK